MTFANLSVEEISETIIARIFKLGLLIEDGSMSRLPGKVLKKSYLFQINALCKYGH